MTQITDGCRRGDQVYNVARQGDDAAGCEDGGAGPGHGLDARLLLRKGRTLRNVVIR